MGYDDKLRVRCHTQTKVEFKKMCLDIDADADYAEIIDTVVAAYGENPDLFDRVHNYATTYDGV